MTAMGGDVYQAAIPGPAVVGDVFNYYITARDLAAVPNMGRHPAAGYHTFAIVDYYAWDFEASGGDFAAAGPDWEWGTATIGPPAAHSGTKLWGTKLAANYSVSSNSKLESPAVTVPTSAPYATLTFWQWYANELNYDGGNVKISTNGGATVDAAHAETSATTEPPSRRRPAFRSSRSSREPTTGNFWHKVTVNLTAYRGQSVKVRFHFGSDGSFQYPGLVRRRRHDRRGRADTDPPQFVSTTVPASTLGYRRTVRRQDEGHGRALGSRLGDVCTTATDNGASWTPVAMAPTGVADEYGGNIPGQPSRTRIKLYLAATDNASAIRASIPPRRAGLRVPVQHHAVGRLPGDPGRRFEYARADLCRRVHRDRQDLRHVELGQPGNPDARDAERLRGRDRGRELVLRHEPDRAAHRASSTRTTARSSRSCSGDGICPTDRRAANRSWRSTPAWPT